MSEPGKMEEGRAKDMNLYQSPRKAETGLDSDRLPWVPWEFTPASQDGLKNGLEIRCSVDEAGSHKALANGGSLLLGSIDHSILLIHLIDRIH